jgi:hypothetical protein
MAQQMEHTGVRNVVQITRAVYDQIKEDQFAIKERGPVDIKGGTVVTWLVSPLAP